jgi:hypothetical protein
MVFYMCSDGGASSVRKIRSNNLQQGQHATRTFSQQGRQPIVVSADMTISAVSITGLR